jgi:hypothetical protein
MAGRLPRLSALGAALALAGVTFALLLGGAASPPAAPAQVSCPAQPTGFSPPGPGPTRFTMLIRINQMDNVAAYTNFNSATGGLGGYIRPQDIFVINTRFVSANPNQPSTTPAVAAQLATALRNAFPCNRIMALNGLTLNPTVAGYAFSLFDHPAVSALLTDFEPLDWEEARLAGAPFPPWSQAFPTALTRVKEWTATLNGTLASGVGAGKRSGLVPLDDSRWNFGQIAQVLDKRNNRLARKRGLQSVQVQPTCTNQGPTGYAARAKQVIQQYKFKTITKKIKVKGKTRTRTFRRKFKKRAMPLASNLALQVSFTDTPGVGTLPIQRTSAATAAACAVAALKPGGGAIFFFASDDAMRLLFQQPQIAALRPPTS